MHRHLLTACASALLAFTLAGCDAGGNEAEGADANAAAADGGTLASDFTRTADALQAKLGAPGEKSEMPGATDPAVQQFNAEAEKAMTALGTPRLPLDGFTSFDAYCAKTAGIVGSYISAGAAGAADAAAQQRQMLSNAQRYVGQMFTPLLFAAHCSARHMPFLEETAAADDLRGKEAALQQIRDGAFSQAAGMIQMAGADDLPADRRARIVDLLAEDAEEFAIALSAEQRQQLAQAAQELAPRLPEDLRGKAGTIAADFTKPPCGKLCSM